MIFFFSRSIFFWSCEFTRPKNGILERKKRDKIFSFSLKSISWFCKLKQFSFFELAKMEQGDEKEEDSQDDHHHH
jgi:hypothetical protein